MRARPPQSATSRHYAEPIQATGGDYDELDGDYDLQPVEHRVLAVRAAHQHGLRRPPRALRDRRLLGAPVLHTPAPDVRRQDTVHGRVLP